MRIRNGARELFGATVLTISIVGCTAIVSSDTPSDDPEQKAVRDGETVFTTEHPTDSGFTASCSQCHAGDGSGLFGPDIRGDDADYLQEQSQGDGPMPVKFPTLTAEQFDDMAAYLRSVCEAASDCEIDDGDQEDDRDADHDQ